MIKNLSCPHGQKRFISVHIIPQVQAFARKLFLLHNSGNKLRYICVSRYAIDIVLKQYFLTAETACSSVSFPSELLFITVNVFNI